MKLLIVEDDITSRLMLRGILARNGYNVVEAADGEEAMKIMDSSDSPMLAVIDWVMPVMDGITLCQKIRKKKQKNPPYLIILTARNEHKDIVVGLEAGANDYISKPYNPDEILARIAVGRRMIELQCELTARVHELESAQKYIEELHGVLPICSHCHKVSLDRNSWKKLEMYLTEHSTLKFSHSVCPECMEKYYSDLDGDGKK